MPPTGFEPSIPASEQLQTHASDRSATGIGFHIHATYKNQHAHARILTITQKKRNFLKRGVILNFEAINEIPAHIFARYEPWEI
jgi:hypothetical protein